MSAQLMDHLRELTVMRKEGLLSDTEFKHFKSKLITMSNEEMFQQQQPQQNVSQQSNNRSPKKEKPRRPSATTNPSPNSSLSTSPSTTAESNPPGSWKCRACGNVNWPMRSYCNRKSCQRPRAQDLTDVIVPLDSSSESDESRLCDSSPTFTDAMSEASKSTTTNASSNSSSSDDYESSSTTTADLPFKFGSLPATSMFEHYSGAQPIPNSNNSSQNTFNSDHSGLYSRSAPTPSSHTMNSQQPPQTTLPAHLQHMSDYMQPVGGLFDAMWPTGQKNTSQWFQQS